MHMLNIEKSAQNFGVLWPNELEISAYWVIIQCTKCSENCHESERSKIYLLEYESKYVGMKFQVLIPKIQIIMVLGSRVTKQLM